MGGSDIYLAILLGTLFLGVPAFLIAAIAYVAWKTRAFSDKAALARVNVAAERPFELEVPAGPAVTLMLHYAVAGRGPVRHPRYGFAVVLEAERATPAGERHTLHRAVQLGTDAAEVGDVPRVAVEWVYAARNSRYGSAPTESSATAMLAQLPAGAAFTVRGRIALAPGTAGRGFTIYAIPTPGRRRAAA